MERKIVRTADGSKTIQLSEWKEQYHSLHGAIQEAYHVFIHHGLSQFEDRELEILEMGFGTGLNALITSLEAPARRLKVRYSALEAYPVAEAEWTLLDYGSSLEQYPEAVSCYKDIHQAPWEHMQPVRNGFSIQKMQMDFLDFSAVPRFDLVYFDAFGARVQPELWTEAIFGQMYSALKPGGILVTYSAKGSVRRAMQASGLITERLPGPPGKREMLRARKPT